MRFISVKYEEFHRQANNEQAESEPVASFVVVLMADVLVSRHVWKAQQLEINGEEEPNY